MRLPAMPKVDVRRASTLAFVTVAVWAVLVTARYTMPAYDELIAARSQLHLLEADYGRLKKNVSISEEVDSRHAQLPGNLMQDGDDLVTLSAFLRDLEAAARYPGLSIVNMRPLQVQDMTTHRFYRVRMALGGKLQDVSAFLADVRRSCPVVGVDSFALRAVQGTDAVEASFVIRTVRTVGHGKQRQAND